ncbi:ATP-binding protein [Kitasatospora herbaricolor]|uniref:ATP-binding protein n=1 Tax=Kitasatospora herbaricolor TaxID=68217 RepID=UPI0036D9A420
MGGDGEVGLLLATLEGTPTVVMGEAGVGKPRLAGEAATVWAGRGTRVLSGFCRRLREPLPFGHVLKAWADWLLPKEELNPQVRVLVPLLPELLGRLPTGPDRLDDPCGRRFQLMGAVRSTLDALGAVVLVVEDLYWVDEATRELLLLPGPRPAEEARPGSDTLRRGPCPLCPSAGHALPAPGRNRRRRDPPRRPRGTRPLRTYLRCPGPPRNLGSGSCALRAQRRPASRHRGGPLHPAAGSSAALGRSSSTPLLPDVT